MIRLQKRAEPAVLAVNAAKWTAKFATDNKLKHYAHPDIRSTLKEEAHHKCAYCEGRMEYVSSSHIDHIRPKSRFPELVCEWSNLTLACEVCNRNKGNYFEKDCLLLNPYLDDPETHLKWYGPMVTHRTPDRGRMTISRLDLNRPELLYKRSQLLCRAKLILDTIAMSPPAVKKALRDELGKLCAQDAEFSAAVGSYVTAEISEQAKGPKRVQCREQVGTRN
jgi:uncharacterized protein (TIGR02646 family)